MSTIQGIQLLVKNIVALSSSLPKSVPNATTQDKIWIVMHTQEGETTFETFNKRFDALFGEDCRDADGHLHHIRQGKNGMGLVCAYLNKIKWTSNIPLDLVEIKLQRLFTELQHLRGPDVGEQQVTARPQRHANPTSRLTNADNVEQSQLSFQRKAVQDFRIRQVQDPPSKQLVLSQPSAAPSQSSASSATPPQSFTTLSTDLSLPPKRTISAVINTDGNETEETDEQPKRCTSCTFYFLSALSINTAKKARVSPSLSKSTVMDSSEDEAEDKPARLKKKHGTLGNPVDVDADNFLLDVDVQSTHEDLGESRVDNHRDVDEFFHAPVMKEMNGKKKKCCTCKLCP
jgi:hypothetical protein